MNIHYGHNTDGGFVDWDRVDKRVKNASDSSPSGLVPVHVWIKKAVGHRFERTCLLMEELGLEKWEGKGKQPGEDFAYQGYVNGQGLASIAYSTLAVERVFWLENYRPKIRYPR